MRNLIIGSSGQVGKCLTELLIKNNEEVIGTYNTIQNKNLPGKFFKLNISNFKNVQHIIQENNPDIIFVPAYNTNVDYCELNEKETNESNINGIFNIVNAINNIKVLNKSKKEPLLVFYSTDYIFDGNQGLYTEKSIPHPLNVYGSQKLLCEQYIKNYSKHFIIIRTTGVFGPEGNQGKNFVTRLVKNLQDGKTADIPDDEFGTPTYAPNLAISTLKLINNIGLGLRNDKNNIVNIAGRNYISRYQFALDIAKVFNCDSKLISPIKSSNLNRPANRPLLGGLDTELIENLIGKKVVGHYDALLDMKKHV